jgi:hypothetical protein
MAERKTNQNLSSETSNIIVNETSKKQNKQQKRSK